MERCGAQAIDIVAKIGVGQVAGQDFILGQPCFQPPCHQQFARLAAIGLVSLQPGDFRQLLRNRAATLAGTARHIGPGRPGNPHGINPPMAIESPVFDRQKRLCHMRRQFGDVHRAIHNRAVAGNRALAAVQQRHLRGHHRPFGLGNRGGKGQPHDAQQDQRDEQHQPALYPLPPARPWGCGRQSTALALNRAGKGRQLRFGRKRGRRRALRGNRLRRPHHRLWYHRFRRHRALRAAYAAIAFGQIKGIV